MDITRVKQERNPCTVCRYDMHITLLFLDKQTPTLILPLLVFQQSIVGASKTIRHAAPRPRVSRSLIPITLLQSHTSTLHHNHQPAPSTVSSSNRILDSARCHSASGQIADCPARPPAIKQNRIVTLTHKIQVSAVASHQHLNS
jgi:hypothetical protein